MAGVAMWLCGCDSELTAGEWSAWQMTRRLRLVEHCCPQHGMTTLAKISPLPAQEAHAWTTMPAQQRAATSRVHPD